MNKIKICIDKSRREIENLFGEDLNLHALEHRRQAMNLLPGVSKKIDKLRKAAEELHAGLYNNLGYYELESMVEHVGGSNESLNETPSTMFYVTDNNAPSVVEPCDVNVKHKGKADFPSSSVAQ